MGTLRTTNIQHADASAAGMILAADGTVSGLRATQNTQSGVDYSLALSDSGRTVTLSNAAAVTVNLPAQATVAWNVGETLSLLNLGAGTVTITPAAGVTINGTPLTLATSKGGSLVRTASNVWTFIPFSAGVEAANFTNTATGTYTDGEGIDYKYKTYTSSSTFTVDKRGVFGTLIVGGGGNGSTGVEGVRVGSGGASGVVRQAQLFLEVGTYTVTVAGAGGRSVFALGAVKILTATGGGGAGASNGGSNIDFSGVAAGAAPAGGAGGGSNANASGGAGGVGTLSSITGSSTYYAGGGGGGGGGGGSNGLGAIGQGGQGSQNAAAGVNPGAAGAIIVRVAI